MKITIPLDSIIEHKPGEFTNQVVLDYIYVDTDHLNLYTSIGQVRAAYPGSEPAAINFSEEDMAAPAALFIREIIPAHVKAWAESLGEQA